MSKAPPPCAFAVIPAAGLSRRMQADKLLLPWGDGLVIDAVIDAWNSAAVETAVVVRPNDVALIEHCRDRDVQLVIPDRLPPRMKDSVRLALDYFSTNFDPQPHDVWLLAPADLPLLSPAVIAQVIRATVDHVGEIIVPTHLGQRGHPTAFPWSLAGEVAHLSDDEGVNVLLQRHPVQYVERGAAAIAPDIDTPEEYRRLRQSSQR